MNTPTDPASRRQASDRNSTRRVLAALLLLVLLPVLGLLIWYITYRTGNSAAIRRLEAKATKRGEPITLAGLAAKYPAIPDDENAAIPLLELWKEADPEFWQAFMEGRRLPQPVGAKVDPNLPILGSKAARPSRVEPLSPAALSAAEDYLKARAAYTERVRAALRRPRCRFPVKVTDGFNAFLPHLAKIKSEAQHFRLESLVATERGDVEAAITALENAARTGNLLADEPFLITHLVRIASLTIALSGAEHLLSRRDLSATQLARLESLFNELKCPGGLRSAYISERATDLSVFDPSGVELASAASSNDGSEEQVTPAEIKTGLGLMRAIGLAGADHRLMLETFDHAIELADKDTPDALAQTRQVFEEATRKARRFPPKVFSGMLLPSERVAYRFANLEARRRAGIAALAVQKSRLTQNRALAQRLDELVPRFLPSIPLDPFDGQPLRYKRLPAGFVVYSIGADGRDNDGLERPPKGNVKEFDETFVIER